MAGCSLQLLCPIIGVNVVPAKEPVGVHDASLEDPTSVIPDDRNILVGESDVDGALASGLEIDFYESLARDTFHCRFDVNYPPHKCGELLVFVSTQLLAHNIYKSYYP
jgi:hypothetical protein